MSWGQEDQPDSEIENTIYEWNYVTNGGSKEMDVNGSSTAVDFSWTPGSNIYIIKSIGLFVTDNSTFNYDEFGSLPALTNGLQIKVRTGGTEYTVANIQDNTDIVQCFGYYPDHGGGAGISDNNLSGQFIFDKKIAIDSSSTDYVRATVRDNLLLVTRLVVSVHAYRVLS